jgi:riboflavin synthase|tara:strand:+ start:306 stop:911 length:606 start_codon:yes stop_codon:yes gene_type:complete
MFTGIVTDIGKIIELEKRGDLRARVETNYDMSTVAIGASIACDGICLTVIKTGSNWFDVEISAESVEKTHLKFNTWAIGASVNLERALRVGDELGGHIVSGHVDGVVEIVDMKDEGDSTRFVFLAPSDLQKFIAPKGSVALNGTSLTVNEVHSSKFGVNVIPHTKEVTTWGSSKIGDFLNLEIDTLARYVARLKEVNEETT